MSYQALYRKYRSQRFDEMVGQEVVATTLKNAIVKGQISHAYLFSGPRGTGKTSAAKIFAKAINCPNQTDGEPCNECEICQSITNGSLEDVIELDAASNNGVDEIREIRDKSTYAASTATYKVYIIDEVHMLSTGAFNALLKTLEEPTENVVFVLATTELQKIPATIISRVQRFAFKSITTADIIEHLTEVLNDETVKFDEKALEIIAKSAEGGMRDALSLLDQALSFSDGESLQEKDALLVTGTIAEEALVNYVKAVSNSDVNAALTELNQIFAEGKNMLRFAEDLLAYLRDELLRENSEIPHEKLYSWIDIAIDSLQTLKETTQTKIAADVMTMRLAEPVVSPILSNLTAIPADLTDEITALKSEIAALKAQIANQPAVTQVQQTVTKTSEKSSAPTGSKVSQDVIFKVLKEATNQARLSIFEAWEEVTASFTKPAEKALIKNTTPVAASENYVVVTFPHEALAQKVTGNADLKLHFSNLLSTIVGFAPEIIALSDDEWQAQRQAYVASLKSGNETTKTEEKTENPVVSTAQELFGDKVRIITE